MKIQIKQANGRGSLIDDGSSSVPLRSICFLLTVDSEIRGTMLKINITT